MAEVENIAAVAAPAAALTPASTAAATSIVSDIPVEAGGSSIASPTQERSSNSHPHDSEYDTASDLEGGDDYDDDDDDDLDDVDDDGESMTDDDEEDEEEDDDIDEDEPGSVGIAVDKDAEAQKKVDEDRRNPQYIPKRGTFYEHDDRTAEGEADGVIITGESGETPEGVSAGIKSPQSPTISQASKTMKKWQAASAVERWSHDRFDASEQAPKSRTELVTAYGYDIRTEDAPPRARRRRRYGRGPSKYSRNWEDENAYLKASNKERKPPRASDFPALNERSSKARNMPRSREEKENRISKRLNVEGGADRTERPPRATNSEDRREYRERTDDKNSNSKHKNYGRSNATVGRHGTMEFKQKSRSGPSQKPPTTNNASHNTRNDAQHDRQPNRSHNSYHQSSNHDRQKMSGKGIGHAKAPHMQINDGFNNNNNSNNTTHNNNNNNNASNRINDAVYAQQIEAPRQDGSIRHAPTTTNTGKTPVAAPSNLSQRLQQAQNRDPSHVGSVQMHALATQNQMLSQQQPQQAANIMLPPAQAQQQQQAVQQLAQEQRGPPKRYSSLRRTQHEAQHIAEQHQLQQQLHLQQQQQQPQPPLMLQDQHVLMQLYHQENLQAQMQALQVGAPGAKQAAAYAAVQANAQPHPGTAPAAYYVATPDAYASGGAATAPQPPQPTPYAQPPPNYMAPAQSAAAATLAYTNAPPPGQPSGVAVPPVAQPAYGPNAAVAAQQAANTGPPTAANANPNYTNYQNYNTVGGTTYFVPPAQTNARPVVLPQRRPTNAIPILPPSEKNKQRTADGKDDVVAKGNVGMASNNGAANAVAPAANAPIGSAENIDHIIDNMFVQRPAFQPPGTASVQTRKSASPSVESSNSGGNSAPSTAVKSDPGNASNEDAASKIASTIEITTSSNTEINNSNVAPPPSTALQNNSNTNPVPAQE